MSNMPNPNASPQSAADPWVTDPKLAVAEALAKASSAIGDAATARDNANAENNRAIGEREAVITRLANAAHLGKWSADDLADIVKDQLKARNATKGAVATFASEVKRACAARVRPHVEELFKLAHDAWSDEDDRIAEAKEAGDDRPATPLRQAFGRCYHGVMASFKAVGEGERDFRTADDFLDFAQATIRARELNYVNVKKRLDAIKAQLAKFHEDFPVEGIGACIEFLGEVSAEDLKACVAAAQPAAEPQADTAEASEEPVEGASDILADINSDLSALAA
jgi:hypothetical protein